MTVFSQLNYLSGKTGEVIMRLIVQGRLGQYPNKSEELGVSRNKRPHVTRNIPCWSRGKCGKHFRFGDGDGTDDEMSFASKVTF